jgi:hypothetical protein
MAEQYVAELVRNLEVANARLGLAIGDPQPRGGVVVEAHVAL